MGRRKAPESGKEATALRLDRALLDAMRDLKDRTGIPVTAQIEMGMRDWLTRVHCVRLKVPTRRGGTRVNGKPAA